LIVHGEARRTDETEFYLDIRQWDGTVSSIVVAAPDEERALAETISKGLVVSSIRKAAHRSISKKKYRKSSFPLLLFTEELLALLTAGLNLTEALHALLLKEHRAGVKETLGQLVAAIREGRSFSSALSESSTTFPAIFIATVRAAERTGDLSDALSRYASYQNQFERVKRALLSASIYPLVLVAVGGMVTLFLLGYVVPRFSAVYEASGRDLPLLSSLLLAWGKTIYEHWYIAGALFFCTIFSSIYVFLNPSIRNFVIELILRFPPVARQANHFRMGRFFRALSLLLLSGIPLPQSIKMTLDVLEREQQIKMKACCNELESGLSFSAVLKRQGMTDPISQSLIIVGERTGQLGNMLERAAQFIDEKFAKWVDRSSKLLEPVLMTVIGLVIGAIVVLMYMPIFDLAGSIS
jgi:general secretion pathway protein F